ncbi:hypothetical protein [Humisphaera borealis]|uniref:Uncharacterized protein n=1 Tax=Humisphaera borealis TaxID=2807512 RepID=A0A7M2WZM9_9BACT|nr:hypothetical protein [Humisphaera borealis]QOV90958.1 hypothetical protein IPV69_06245 [Humisphaera borealis]
MIRQADDLTFAFSELSRVFPADAGQCAGAAILSFLVATGRYVASRDDCHLRVAVHFEVLPEITDVLEELTPEAKPVDTTESVGSALVLAA